MKDEEKNLIENLFHRLKNTELNSPQRDEYADNLIQSLVKKQPVSSYYMVQTILIQETAIKKMNTTIEELKKRIENLNTTSSNKPSFLSNFFSTNSDVQKKSHDSSNIWKNKDNPQKSYISDPTASKTAQISPNSITTTTKTSGFLSNALQTATGVAGGMILGNMLMNVFNHTKPEEEIFDNVDRSSLVDHNTAEPVDHDTLVDHDTFNSNSDSHLINNDELTNADTDSNSFNLNDSYDSDYDIDDDNFV